MEDSEYYLQMYKDLNAKFDLLTAKVDILSQNVNTLSGYLKGCGASLILICGLVSLIHHFDLDQINNNTRDIDSHATKIYAIENKIGIIADRMLRLDKLQFPIEP